jgi:hypothetical protein
MIRNPSSTQTGPGRNGEAPAPSLAPPTEFLSVDDDPAVAELQGLLLGQYRDRLVDLRAHLAGLQTTLATVEHEVELLNDIEQLAEKIKPSLAPAISASIRESREEMIEALSPIIARLIGASIHDSRDSMIQALLPIIDKLISTSVRESSDNMVDALYPIIGRLVSRAVAESLRDLVQRIDDQMRAALDFQWMMRRVQARLTGVSEAELALRTVLPFQVLQIFLIHQETGLLLNVLAQDPQSTADSDLISSMLTAIRDFAQDAIGRGQEADLDEVQYGDKKILIETARYTYLALVSEGIEPIGFRAQVRERLLTVEQSYLALLRRYDGNAAPLAGSMTMLRPLLIRATAGPPHAVPLVRHDRTFRLAPTVRLTFALVLFALLLSVWRLWQVWVQTPVAADQFFEWLGLILL